MSSNEAFNAAIKKLWDDWTEVANEDGVRERRENPKQIADHVGNSAQVIFSKYAKWIGGQGAFG